MLLRKDMKSSQGSHRGLPGGDRIYPKKMHRIFPGKEKSEIWKSGEAQMPTRDLEHRVHVSTPGTASWRWGRVCAATDTWGRTGASQLLTLQEGNRPGGDQRWRVLRKPL